MKRYIIVFYVLHLCLILGGQNTYNGPYDLQYIECAACVVQDMNLHPSNITSDFGPRYLSSTNPYDWHQGIDFSPGAGTADVGYRIKAIEGGTVSKIGRHGGGTDPLWFIAIDGAVAGVEHDFAYEHIFPKNSGTLPVTSGGFTLVELEHSPSTPDRYGILTPNNNLLSDCQPCTGYYYVSGSTTINATNQVSIGDFIAPLGQSGAEHAHLHLNRYESIQSNWTNYQYVNGNTLAIDPFQILGHDGARYDVTVHRNGGTNPDLFPQGIGIVYPGTQTSKLMVRPTMNGEGNGSTYNNSILNISEVETMIAKERLYGIHIENYDDFMYDLIKGPNYRSEIVMGATMQDNVQYPTGIHTQIGNWNKTGIRPYAYKDSGARPWDDYFFSDFVSRIHKDDQMTGTAKIANCPQDARYNDGPYELKARVTDVRGGYYEGPRNSTGELTPIKFNLDNYKPFIERVKVDMGYDDIEVYDMHWEYENSCGGIKPVGGIISSELQPEDFSRMTVHVKTSEPLQNFNMGVMIDQNGDIESNPWSDPLVTELHPAIVEDGFDLGFTVYISSSIVDELGSDPLIRLFFNGTDYPIDVNGTNPNRLLNLTDYFSPDDPSLNTSCLEIPTRQNALDNEETWSSTIPEYAEAAHRFTLHCFSDGNIVEDDPSKNSIKIVNGSCCSDEFLEDLEASMTLERNEKCICADYPIQAFSLEVNPADGPYTFKWNGPEGYFSTAQNPNDISIPGLYTVKVTTENGCRVELSKNINACIPLNEPYIIADPICDESGLGNVELNMNHSAGYSFQWLHGATTQNLENVPAGGYTVVVSNNESCQIFLTAELLNGYDETFSSTLESEIDCICSVDNFQQAFTLSVEGADTPFNFNWTGPNGFFSGEQSPLVSQPGDYTVTITNASGCELIEEINIPSCSEDFQGTTIVLPTCLGEATGEASVVVTGLGSPFEYLWSTGETLHHITDLAAGTYQVTVTDKFECQLVETVVISNAPPIEIANSPIIVDCFGEGMASITLDIIEGAGSYSYSWSTGETGPTINDLSAGNYAVTITNQHQCSQSFYFVVVSSDVIPVITETVTDATCEKPFGSISLDIEPAGDYAIQWSDGVIEELERSELSVGNYEVTVTDENGCSVSETYVIENLQDQVDYWDGISVLSTTESSTATSCNGSIELELDGNYGPYSIVLLDPDGNVVTEVQDASGIVTLSDLCPTGVKTYEIIITDINGCTKEFQKRIRICYLQIVLEHFNRPEDQEDDSGSLSVGVSGEHQGVQYDWDNGESGAVLNDIAPGSYSVTATDENGCDGTATFVLEGCYSYIYGHEDEPDDLVIIGMEANFEEFEIEIVGGLFLDGATTSEASILIKEDGQNSFVPINLAEYHVDWYISSDLIGSDESPITLSAPSGISTFLKAVVYKDNCFSAEASIRLLACGSDLGGHEDWLLPEILLGDVAHPCGGLDNGSFTIEIPTSGISTIDITVNDITQSYSSFGENILFSQVQTNLEPGVYDITIVLDGNCTFSFPFTMNDQPAERTFSDIDMESETCFYDLSCDDVELGTLEESSTRLYHLGHDFPCALPLSCGSFVTDSDKRLDRLTFNGMEAVDFLNTLSASGLSIYSPSAINDAIAKVQDRANWQCKRVKICPANLNVSFSGFFGDIFITAQASGGGCYEVVCALSGTHWVCPTVTNSIFLNEYGGIISPNDPVFSCDANTTNVSFLFSAIANDFDEQEVFPQAFWDDSQLLQLFLDYTNDGTESYPVAPHEIYCARISYCVSDFSILNHNIDEVSCGVVDSGVFDHLGNEVTNTCAPFSVEVGGVLEQRVLCESDNGTLFQWYRDSDEIFALQGEGTGSWYGPVGENLGAVHNIVNGQENEILTGFAYHKWSDMIVPKGIIQTENERALYDFDHDVTHVNKFPTSNEILFLVDDWKTEQTVDVSRVSDTECLLTYQDGSIFWSQEITSNGEFLDVQNLFFENDQITLVVSAESDLFIKGIALSNEEKSSYNIVSIDAESGEIIDAKVMQGLTPSETKVVKKDNGIDLLTKNTASGIQMGGQALYPLATNEWVNLSISSNEIGFVEKGRMSSNEDFDVISYAVAPSSTRETMVLKHKEQEGSFGGNGVISIQSLLNNSNAGSVTYSNDQYAQFCTIDANGSLVWQSGIGQTPNSEIFETLTTYDSNGLLYAVITFSGSITFQGQSYMSLGGKDILILKINASGQLISDDQFGTIDDEEVTEVFATQAGLYFGGTFSGATLSRQLGNYEIVNQTNDATSKVFVTFLSGDQIQGLEHENTDGEWKETLLEKESNINQLIAYPNPFKNSFNLEFNSSLNDVVRIKVLDVLGRSIVEFDEQVKRGPNKLEINMNDISSSQLLNVVIEFKSDQQPSLYTRLIRA